MEIDTREHSSGQGVRELQSPAHGRITGPRRACWSLPFLLPGQSAACRKGQGEIELRALLPGAQEGRYRFAIGASALGDGDRGGRFGVDSGHG